MRLSTRRTIWAVIATCGTVAAQAAEDPVDFNRQIRPILSHKCFSCHGADDKHREAGLRLDQRDAAIAKLDSGSQAIVPGDTAKSALIERIVSSDPDLRMPPADSGAPLHPEEIALLKHWIETGAPYAEHWSFLKPVRSPLPAVHDASPIANAIDVFVLARLERNALKHAPIASRYELIRRLSLDLRGLPPSPEEVAEFVNDAGPDAYERLVERFLNDATYGERWAAMWLDLARYADSKGYGSDPLRTIWKYRDWIIDAFNRNLPFDQFTIEQLAGDLLPDATLEQRIATAFHRNTMTNTEGGTDDEEFRVLAVKDRVDSTMQIWMGLTMGCANCHTHKYDPISQREYYQFFALFNQTADNDQPDESPVTSWPEPELEARRAALEAEIVPLRTELEALQATPLAETATQPEKEQRAAQEKTLNDKIAELEQQKPEIPTVPVMQELGETARRQTFLMEKGYFLAPGDAVTGGLPAAFHAPVESSPTSRLGVALWIVNRDNPLTARVAVNRFWAQKFFGVGLVATEGDFGTQGDSPSHPELLDWLAVEFMDSGWDVKQLLKTIVTSRTYRQSAQITPESFAADPNNRLLARGPRVRLEAEMVRDQALELAGLLVHKKYGPSVFPPQPPNLWQAAFNGRDRTWSTSMGPDRYRRGLYTFWRRTIPYPSMTTFDAPSREICSVCRVRTNTPLQAFVTLNDPVYVEAAQALARRIAREGGTTPIERAAFALTLCLARPAEQNEIDTLVTLYESEIAHYRSDPAGAEKLATDPLGPVPAGTETADLAAWTVVANVLLNLDGVLTR